MATVHIRVVLVMARCILALTLAACAAAPLCAQPLAADTMSSVVMDHEVQTGASLAALAARFGVPAAVIARDNALHPGAALVPGQILKIASHHLLPQALVQDLSDGIVINVPQRMLFRLRSGRIAAAYPAALVPHFTSTTT